MPDYPRIRLPGRFPAVVLPLAAAVVLLSGAGCSAASRRAAEEAVAPPTVTQAPGSETRPLSGLASQRVLLLPVQRVESANGASAGGTAAALPAAMDAELAFVLGERGLGSRWVTASAARRLADRNPGMGLEPATLPLPPARQLERGPVKEPLSGQLRALAALADARYVIVPTALRLAASASGGAPGSAPGVIMQGEGARLMLVLVDVRAAQILWAGSTEEVRLESSAPALGATIASHFADLIAAPRAP